MYYYPGMPFVDPRYYSPPVQPYPFYPQMPMPQQHQVYQNQRLTLSPPKLPQYEQKMAQMNPQYQYPSSPPQYQYPSSSPPRSPAISEPSKDAYTSSYNRTAESEMATSSSSAFNLKQRLTVKFCLKFCIILSVVTGAGVVLTYVLHRVGVF